MTRLQTGMFCLLTAVIAFSIGLLAQSDNPTSRMSFPAGFHQDGHVVRAIIGYNLLRSLGDTTWASGLLVHASFLRFEDEDYISIYWRDTPVLSGVRVFIDNEVYDYGPGQIEPAGAYPFGSNQLYDTRLPISYFRRESNQSSVVPSELWVAIQFIGERGEPVWSEKVLADVTTADTISKRKLFSVGGAYVEVDFLSLRRPDEPAGK